MSEDGNIRPGAQRLAPEPRWGATAWAGRRAFTLIEVLVAMFITVVVVGFMIVIVNNVSSYWSRTSGRVSAEAQGRFVIEQLTLDLQSALYRDDGNIWLAATIPANTANTGLWSNTQTTATAIKPPNAAGSLQTIATGSIANARFGIAGSWLRFFTTKRGPNNSVTTASTPVAVAYQIVRRATSGNEARSADRRYLLHRTEVRPTSLSSTALGTFESGFNITAAAYAPTTNTVRQVNDPAEIRYPTINSVIAENVIDFGVRLFVRDANVAGGLRQVFPTSNATLNYNAKSPSTAVGVSDTFPEVIDVMVRVLTDEGARVVAGYEAAPQRITLPVGRTAQEYWWDLALANSQVFTRRISVQTRSP
jgi:type II secretory pathway pseudopilin PulG